MTKAVKLIPIFVANQNKNAYVDALDIDKTVADHYSLKVDFKQTLKRFQTHSASIKNYRKAFILCGFSFTRKFGKLSRKFRMVCHKYPL